MSAFFPICVELRELWNSGAIWVSVRARERMNK